MTDRNYKCFVVNVFFFATHGAPFRCQLLVSQQPTMVGTKYSSSSRHHQQETMSSFLQQLIVPQNFIRLSSLNRKVFKCHFLCAPTVYRLDYYYHLYSESLTLICIWASIYGNETRYRYCHHHHHWRVSQYVPFCPASLSWHDTWRIIL